jgi:hypothetical protein
MDDKTLEERIQLAVERVNEKLRTSIDSAILDYNKLVGDNNKLL